MELNFKQRLSKVKAVVLDIDGVLTDGSLTIMPDGEAIRKVNNKDGYALSLAVKQGVIVSIISGGHSQAVKRRLGLLGITDIYLGVRDKMDSYNELKAIYDLSDEQVVYMGDDMPDLEVMGRVGVPTCPADAAPEVKAISIYISPKEGGKGCVRDIVEQVLRVQSKWK